MNILCGLENCFYRLCLEKHINTIRLMTLVKAQRLYSAFQYRTASLCCELQVPNQKQKKSVSLSVFK